MDKFPTSDYMLVPITDDLIDQRYCDWLETITDLEFEDAMEEEKKFAYIDTLAILIQAYESKQFKFNREHLTLSQVIEQALEQLNLTKKDLSKMLGSNRVSEIFSGKRQMSLAQIKKLHKELTIPTDLLLGV